MRVDTDTHYIPQNLQTAAAKSPVMDEKAIKSILYLGIRGTMSLPEGIPSSGSRGTSSSKVDILA